MPVCRSVHGASAAVFSALVSMVAVSQAEAANRCPSGEVFRPSRGICQSREVAASQGIFNFWPFSSGKEDKVDPPNFDKPKAASRRKANVAKAEEPVLKPKAKPQVQALVQIEKRAPLEARPREALAFSPTSRKPAEPAPAPVIERAAVTEITPRFVQSIPVSLKPREPSPFGSLIAFEPVQR